MRTGSAWTRDALGLGRGIASTCLAMVRNRGLLADGPYLVRHHVRSRRSSQGRPPSANYRTNDSSGCWLSAWQCRSTRKFVGTGRHAAPVAACAIRRSLGRSPRSEWPQWRQLRRHPICPRPFGHVGSRARPYNRYYARSRTLGGHPHRRCRGLLAHYFLAFEGGQTAIARCARVESLSRPIRY